MTAGHATSQPSSERQLRQAIIETALSMSRRGLSPGRSGNVSCRLDDGMLITPTGVAYETMSAGDIVRVAADGSVAPDAMKPSSEWRFHLAAYRARADINAVVHTHSLHATVLACAHRPIPAFHYMVAVAGGIDIPIVPYAPFGTEELAGYVAQGLEKRNACLMANHGQIAAGPSLAAALELAFEVETLAEQYFKVLLLGPANTLSGEQMRDVLERFASYGQNAQSPRPEVAAMSPAGGGATGITKRSAARKGKRNG
ncbi:MAG: class II aldolase/adducin family protein [Hyphomicrobiaceae bacterium]